MLCSIKVRLFPHLEDHSGRVTAEKIRGVLGIPVTGVRIVTAYVVEGITQEDLEKVLAAELLHDPVLNEATIDAFSSEADWAVEVGFRPGVTDNTGRTARDTIALFLGRDRNFAVYSLQEFHIFGAIQRRDVERIGKDFLANELIQRLRFKSKEEWQQEPGFAPQSAKVGGSTTDTVDVIPFSSMDDEALMAYSRDNTLALSLEELQAIKAHYADPTVRVARQKRGLPQDPTDAEVEVLAQTWSEHCKHKIFSSFIQYENMETGRKEGISSLYKTCIQGSTKVLRARMGEKDYCRSVFKDNAGVVAFTDTHDMCIKVETHNSPSALDPYGGAMTGVIGVNRDALGTGIGADFVCNSDVLCVASPFYEGALPPRLLHPRRILEGAREGVEHGGNKSGVPTVNGSLVFDERFLGKPLVYCGTVGLLPHTINGRHGYEKKAMPGDAIVMIGGRIGKDGIHGATFSSEELHEDSPATAVQIGDPITQRKLYDCVLKARSLGLYNSITDNGAGGLSSSVGEMAEDTGGCVLDLAKALVKYDGLKPWEILLSEAQERMTLAVPQEHLAHFLRLADEMDVEASALGTFTDSGYFEVVYQEEPVAFLPMDFMHDGVPQMRLRAAWQRPEAYPIGEDCLLCGVKPVELDRVMQDSSCEHEGLLSRMLGRLNICSKESIIRQFDHEAKGGSVIKPLMGACSDGPTDAAVIRPILEKPEGIVLSHGICPKFSDADTYWMMANAIDEAVRNAVAVGADPDTLAGVDNFCWCDPVESEKTPDGAYKLAQLVRANKALEHFCLGFGVPCVSGKDSMKNDYTGGGEKISIPPTVLFSVLGKMPDVECAISSDLKQAGDAIYLLGMTHRELGGSEVASELGLSGGAIPQVDVLTAKNRYRQVYRAIRQKLLSACHDLSDGGLAVAIAEMSLSGRLGAEVDLSLVPAVQHLSVAELLYSESASRLLVTVPVNAQEQFEQLFKEDLGFDAARIGTVTDADVLVFQSAGSVVLTAGVEDLAAAFSGTLRW